ncbi:MAG: hypothetical protein BWK76_14760 [Desulfobulbaceae bacterium A2]|nr:MAG: hypothetical protein BWK76_14760 [Desulfobulbaceae bacterium A2]
MAPTLLLGIGNTLRGDDGVGSRVLELLAGRPNAFRLIAAPSLLPELALEVALSPLVVFVDADLRVQDVTLERLSEETVLTAGHVWSPEMLVVLARGLGFSGDAWICRIPVATCGHGEGLSTKAESAAQAAVSMLLGVGQDG